MIRLTALVAFLVLAFFLVNAARNSTLSSHKSQANEIINQIQ